MTLLFILLVVFVVGLIVAIVLLVRQLQQSQAAEEIEKTITTQADADIERSTPGQLAEMQSLKEELLAAIETLKQSAKKGNEDALARLPWYMVIGPAGAGKSELIRRSGLHFPLQDSAHNPRAVRGVGGTRGFSWWLAHEAVLLDMAGRTLATAAFDDSGDWVAFLQMLRKQRPAKPINGVLVVVAIDQIADQPEARIDSIARAARERIEELVQHLGVIFPVYVVFNRCDQVSGFAEFFEDLAQDARREPWGATLSLERARSHAAETLFDEEAGILQAALSERRVPRMAAMPEAVTRSRAFAFPLQFERVRGNLRRFVRTLFEAEKGSDAPPFRGFYFTAAAQDGEPTDRVLQPAVRALGLTFRTPEGFEPPRGGATFVRDLYTEVVFPDAGLATTSSGAQGALQKRDRLLIGGCGLAFLVLTTLFAGFSCYNGALVTHTRQAADAVATNVRADGPLVDNLRALDRLRQQAHTLDSLKVHGAPLARRLGGYAANTVADPAARVWMAKAVETLVDPAARQMGSELRNLTDTNQGDFLHYFFLFRAWRLLGSPDQITPDDADVLANEVTRALQGRLRMATTIDDQRAYPDLVRRQMRFLCDHPAALAPYAAQYRASSDADLVVRAAQRVKLTWDPRQVYQALIADAQHDCKPLTLRALVGDNPVLSDAVTVPGPFTLAGWKSAVKPRIDGYRRLMQRDRALQEVFQPQTPDLAGDLMGMYAREYSARWAAFLGGVTLQQLQQGSTLKAAMDLLGTIGDGKSPFIQLIHKAADQTRFGVDAGTALGQVQGDFAMLPGFFDSNRGSGGGGQSLLDKGKTAWTNMTGGKGASEFDNSVSPYANYQKFLKNAQKALNDAGALDKPISELNKLIASTDDGTSPLRALSRYPDLFLAPYADAAGVAPMRRLLALPINGATAAAISTAVNPALAAAWKQQVYEPFMRTLGGRYPFAASRQDASLIDFANCFAPAKGYFWVFFTQNLAPFLNEDGSPKGANVPVSPATIEFVRKAYDIRQNFFAAGDAPKLDFTASASPPRIDGPQVNVPWVALDCGGTRVTYNMGPQSESPLSWPGTDLTAGASVIANASLPTDPHRKLKKGQTDSVPVETKTGEGLWGLFRLIDLAQDATDTGGSASVTWSLAAGSSRLGVTWQLRGPGTRSVLTRGALRLNPPAVP